MEKKDCLTQIYEAESEREKQQESGASDRDYRTEEAPLSLKATMKLMGGTLMLALGIGAVFLLVFLLFILFCIYVWF